MIEQAFVPFGTHNVLAVILGGGRGTRLFPLTQDRAKPAVPLGGKYRLVDIPISNCINSGLLRIFLLTQFNSASLHRHISQSYKFDHFTGGFVEILAAEQTMTDDSWYQGTADAVLKNWQHFKSNPFEYMLILSGDQLYRMDYRLILSQHLANRADVTVATIPVERKDVAGFGLMKLEKSIITEFVEKPKDPAVQDQFKLGADWNSKLGLGAQDERFLASMGIYVFNRTALIELLDEAHHDFGKDVIPRALKSHRVCAYVFQGAWEDLGTVRAFFDSNMDMASAHPRFNIHDMASPLFTRPRFLPATKINGGTVQHSLIADGCILNDASVKDSVLGLRSVIGSGTRLDRTIVMGSDYYETEPSGTAVPALGIGDGTIIETAIVDKNARVGNNCRISPKDKPNDVDHALYFIRDGIVIIPKNGIVPHGTII